MVTELQYDDFKKYPFFFQSRAEEGGGGGGGGLTTGSLLPVIYLTTPSPRNLYNYASTTFIYYFLYFLSRPF